MTLDELSARPHEGFTLVEDADAHRALTNVGITFPDDHNLGWNGSGPRILYCVEPNNESHWILGVRFAEMPERVDDGHLAMFLPKCRYTEAMMNAKLEMLLAIIGKEANAVCVNAYPASTPAFARSAALKAISPILPVAVHAH